LHASKYLPRLPQHWYEDVEQLTMKLLKDLVKLMMGINHDTSSF
jgi:hypothetical protein